MSRVRALLAIVVLAALAPAAALAAGGGGAFIAWGPRVGVSLSPDQLVFGGQVTTHDIAPRVTLDPDVEFGLGDHQTVLAVNGDFHYHLTLEDSDWTPYVGLGIGVNFFDTDRPFPEHDLTETNVGLNLIAGSVVPTGSTGQFFAEAKIGAGDIPSLKLIAGWNFPIH